ncbi:hypothetical protein EDF74_3326 [Stenotrophomonas rhizophila]|nr:hypothetical protein EDF74_3326 [Stenotrophomonas rhizophila]
MHTKNGDTHITNNYYYNFNILNSDHAAVTLPCPTPPPKQPPWSTNCAALALQALTVMTTLARAAPALAPYLGPLLGN